MKVLYVPLCLLNHVGEVDILSCAFQAMSQVGRGVRRQPSSKTWIRRHTNHVLVLAVDLERLPSGIGERLLVLAAETGLSAETVLDTCLRHALLLLLPLVPLGLVLWRRAALHVVRLNLRLLQRYRPARGECDLLVRAHGLVGALRLVDRLHLQVLVLIAFSIELQDDVERLGILWILAFALLLS